RLRRRPDFLFLLERRTVPAGGGGYAFAPERASPPRPGRPPPPGFEPHRLRARPEVLPRNRGVRPPRLLPLPRSAPPLLRRSDPAVRDRRYGVLRRGVRARRHR